VGLTGAEMINIIKQHQDINNTKTILCELIEEHGHICVYLPKYHCELNPIERCWCHAKKYTRAYSNGSIIRLRKTVPEGLNTVTKEMIYKFCRTCNDYQKAYLEGYTRNVASIVKIYKSHHHVLHDQLIS